MNKELRKIFDAEDEKDLKQGFKNLILEQFEKDLNDNEYYLFDPERIRDMLDEAFTEAIEEVVSKAISEIQENIKSVIMQEVMSKLGGNNLGNFDLGKITC